MLASQGLLLAVPLLLLVSQASLCKATQHKMSALSMYTAAQTGQTSQADILAQLGLEAGDMTCAHPVSLQRACTHCRLQAMRTCYPAVPLGVRTCVCSGCSAADCVHHVRWSTCMCLHLLVVLLLVLISSMPACVRLTVSCVLLPMHTWARRGCHITDAERGQHTLCGALQVLLQLIQLPAQAEHAPATRRDSAGCQHTCRGPTPQVRDVCCVVYAAG